MIRRILPIVLLFLSSVNLMSQSGVIDPKSRMQQTAPLSAEVGMIDKYAMSPPNYSNGLPQQNIPLFEIKENGLSFPMSLFYNYSGFRVKEEATSIGLGWGLTEGVIVREVKHIPDDHLGLMKKFEDYTNFDEEIGPGYVSGTYYYGDGVPDYIDYNTHSYTRNRQFYKYYDAQPDVYVYNFAGYNGKFLWLNNKAIKIDHNDLLIEGGGSPGVDFAFTITSPEGIQYKFSPADKIEITPANIVHPPVCDYRLGLLESYTDYGYTTAWRLTEMKSNITQAKMTFKYTVNYSAQEKTAFQASSVTLIAPLQFNGSYLISNYQKDESYTKTVTTNWYISEIESDNFKAIFTTGTRLDADQSRVQQINIFNKSNLQTAVKTISFTHSYFGDNSSPDDCWLKLQKLRIDGEGKNNEYQFSYIDENTVPAPKSSLAIDHWGYYNGAGNNTTLVPLTGDFQAKFQGAGTFNPVSLIAWADRSTHIETSRIFALGKVTYPTKGYSQLTYESSSGKGIRVASIEDNDGIKSNFRYFNYGSNFTYPAIYTTDESYNYQNCGTQVIPDYGGGALDLPVNTKYYTYGSVPDGSLNFIPDNNPFYETVTEFIGTPDGQGGKTIYNFTKMNAIGNEIILTEKDQYKYGSTDPVYKEIYTYSTPLLKTIPYWLIPTMYNQLVPSEPCGHDPYTRIACGPTDFDKGYILQDLAGGVAQTYSYWKRLDGIETFTQGVHTSKTYTYRDIDAVTGIPKHTSPIRMDELLSNGKQKKTYLYYAGDIDPDNNAATLGIPQMYIAPVVKSKTFVDNNLVSLETNSYSYDAVNGLILNTGYEGLPAGQQAGLVKWTFGYDNKGKLTDAKKEKDMPKSSIYGYNNLFTIAEAINATHDQIAYTSFEAEDFGGWTGILPANIQFEGKSSITGTKSYLLTNGSIQRNVSSAQTYIVSYWSKNGGVNVNGTSAKQGRSANINGQTWTYYEHKVSGVSVITVSGSVTIDELRLYPENAQMFTYSYDPLKGLISKSDVNSIISYFEFDDFARLYLVRDQNYNIVKKICYSFSGQVDACSAPLTYWNDIQSGIFTPNNCPSGQIGLNGVLYTVPAHTYSSTVSKDDANLIAQNEVNANGQNYANSNGSCVANNIRAVLSIENQTGNQGDVVIRFYSPNGSPYSVSNLTVNVEETDINDVTDHSTNISHQFVCNGSEVVVLASVLLIEPLHDPLESNIYRYFDLLPGNGYIY